jgi:hypothetical protein
MLVEKLETGSLLLGIFLCVTCPIKRRGILLSTISVLGSEMKHLKKGKKNESRVTAAKVFLLATIIVIIVATAGTTIIGINWSADAFVIPGLGGRTDTKAPSVVSGDNIYIAWWTNNTENGNEEVMFRASNDGGATFSDKMNLSNTPNADSWRVEIAGEGDTVVVSWWETNQTSDIPVAKVSNDSGETFGPLVMLAANGTIGSGEAEEIAVVEEGGEEG